jgi:hypothetical protein
MPNPDTKAETPSIPKGTQRAFWCLAINEGATRPRACLLLYCNGYIMPLSDSCDEAPKCAVPIGEDGDYEWTGWVEESCEQCDTFWTFNGRVISWMELPTDAAGFSRLALLEAGESELAGAARDLLDAILSISDLRAGEDTAWIADLPTYVKTTAQFEALRLTLSRHSERTKGREA